MKQFTSKELRNTWKEFYKERGHVDVGAVSLVSDGSTGVMFNVAGMQTLMPYLLGQKHPMGTRLCNVQGCVRTNDIDSVGDKSHVTFFEMMGSWSLGDYFKEDRCKWSYELLTQVFGFDRDHLAATVFEGDENAPRDEEGAKCRIDSGFKPENIYYLPAEDNWWGLEYGPCGPDSEMFYIADVPDCGQNCGPGCSCGKYTELGNDVFMQYEKHKDGLLTPLDKKNVDTGWGLERNLAFLNGTKDVYKTDLFAAVIAFIEKRSGEEYDKDDEKTRSMRVLSDHMRTSVMLIGDEARLTPSNGGAGYVLRRLIRRAVRHGRILSLTTEDFLDIAKIFIDEVYSDSYPNLITNREFVLKELKKEIDRFTATLENGMKEFKKILDSVLASSGKSIPGKDAFYLYDTFGFPLELTVEMAGEQGLLVDEAGFEKSMEEQKQKARDNANFSLKSSSDELAAFKGLDESVVTEFTGYEKTEDTGKVVAIAALELTDEAGEGLECVIVTDKTPFYATMGGQKGDFGCINAGNFEFEVKDTVKIDGGRVGHVGIVKSGKVRTGDTVTLTVDPSNRTATCMNHSATHLLQKALQTVLGDEVKQQGSYQDGERTRFDFSFSRALNEKELERVEEIVNEKITEDIPVITDIMSIEDAKKSGAMALFGEKYGEVVRVVRMGDFSKELCGGTHVKKTGDIHAFKIISESGIAAGVRRVEGLTGTRVLAYYKGIEDTLRDAAAVLKASPADLADRIGKLKDEVKALSSELESLKSKAAKESMGDVMDKVIDVKGVRLLATSVPGVDMNGLRDLGDMLKDKIGDGVILLASDSNGRVNLVAMATDGAMNMGAHAGNLIKGVAGLVGGGGGGRPNMAQAGGKDPSGIDEALKTAATVLAKQIK
ncbi:MAG: alanine--tRNA ligase [Lachnospiraceae bacterium]|nr:alanine--tRNA ligase [Lachnospiraceae bacterium]